MDIDYIKRLAAATVIVIPVAMCIVLLVAELSGGLRKDNDIAAYCGDTYTLDVSPLRTKVSCRGEEYVIFPNVDQMSPEEFRAYREARDKIPIGLKRDLREM